MKNKLFLLGVILSLSYLHGTMPNPLDRLVPLTNKTTFDAVCHLCNNMHKDTNAPERSGRMKRAKVLQACAQGVKRLNISDTGRHTNTPIYFDVTTSEWVYSNGNKIQNGCSSLIELTWIENAHVFAAIKKQKCNIRYLPEQFKSKEDMVQVISDCSDGDFLDDDAALDDNVDVSPLAERDPEVLTISQQLIKKLKPYQSFLLDFVNFNDFLGLCFNDGNEAVFKTVHQKILVRYFLCLLAIDEESEAYDREYRHVCNLASIFAGYFGEIDEDALDCINEHLIALENEQWAIADMLVASHLLPEDKIALFYSIDDSLYADIEWLYNEFIVKHKVDALTFSQLMQLLISNADILELFLHTIKECSETYKNVYLLVVKNSIIFSHVMHIVLSSSDMYDWCTVLTQQFERIEFFLDAVAVHFDNNQALVQQCIALLCTYPHLILLFFDRDTFVFHDEATLAAMINYCFTVEHSTLTLNHGIRMALTNGWNNIIAALCEHNEAIVRILSNESMQQFAEIGLTLAGLKTGISQLDATTKKTLLQGHIVPTLLEWVLRGDTVDAIQQRYAALESLMQGYREDEPLYRFAHYAIRDAQLLDLMMVNVKRALDLAAMVDAFVVYAQHINHIDKTNVSNFVKDNFTTWLSNHYRNLLAQSWFLSLKPKLAMVIKNRICDELITKSDNQLVLYKPFADSDGQLVPVQKVMDHKVIDSKCTQIVACNVNVNASLWQRVTKFLKKTALCAVVGIGIWLYLKNTSSDEHGDSNEHGDDYKVFQSKGFFTEVPY